MYYSDKHEMVLDVIPLKDDDDNETVSADEEIDYLIIDNAYRSHDAWDDEDNIDADDYLLATAWLEQNE